MGDAKRRELAEQDVDYLAQNLGIGSMVRFKVPLPEAPSYFVVLSLHRFPAFRPPQAGAPPENEPRIWHAYLLYWATIGQLAGQLCFTTVPLALLEEVDDPPNKSIN